MRFSGHETFPIRDGWLHKGMKLLLEEPETLFCQHAADHLGVGKNMARSIRHWLRATGLAELDGERRGHLHPTDFAREVTQHDTYFAEPGTWWFLHVNLASEPAYSDTWLWFFNRFAMDRFERATVVENLRQYVQMQSPRTPSLTTLDRDVACLLASYGRPIPADTTDPEESRDCPFRELGLMSHLKSSGYYQVNQGVKSIPPEALGYSLGKAFPEVCEGNGTADISIHHAAQRTGGPGRVFCLSPETLFEVVLAAEQRCGDNRITVTGHAGNRMIRVRKQSLLEWVRQYYSALEEEGSNAA